MYSETYKGTLIPVNDILSHAHLNILIKVVTKKKIMKVEITQKEFKIAKWQPGDTIGRANPPETII